MAWESAITFLWIFGCWILKLDCTQRLNKMVSHQHFLISFKGASRIRHPRRADPGTIFAKAAEGLGGHFRSPGGGPGGKAPEKMWF